MKIFDSHNDLLSKVKSKEEVRQYFAKNKDATIFCAYFSFNNDKNVNLVDLSNKFKWLNSQKRAIKSVENAWFLTKNNLKEFVKLKPFCVGLVHNKNNNLCGGALDNGFFSFLGEFVVKELEKNDIIVDTAHMNQKSFWEFEKITQKPLFCSHTGFKEKFNHKRNLDNFQIKAVVECKGYIGMALYPNFFTEKNYTIKMIAQNILWFWGKYGVNTLGIGTDFNGIDKYPYGVRNYEDLIKLEKELIKYGAKKVDIDKLFFKNLENFILKTNKGKN